MCYLILRYYIIIVHSYINIAQFLYLQSSYIINRYCSSLLHNLIGHSVAHLNIFILGINLFCFFFTLLLCGISVLSLFWSYSLSLSHRSYSLLFWPFIFSSFFVPFHIYLIILFIVTYILYFEFDFNIISKIYCAVLHCDWLVWVT